MIWTLQRGADHEELHLFAVSVSYGVYSIVKVPLFQFVILFVGDRFEPFVRSLIARNAESKM